MDFAALWEEEKRALSRETAAGTDGTTPEGEAEEGKRESEQEIAMREFMSLEFVLDRAEQLDLEVHKLEAPSSSRESELNTVYYIPNWVSEEEEERLLAMTYEAPVHSWTHLKMRSLQRWGGEVSSKNSEAEPLPPWLAAVSNRLVECGVFEPSCAPNHVLINEYLPGQGIMAHTDGPLYHPVVATISLGSSGVMQFFQDHQVMLANLLPFVIPSPRFIQHSFALAVHRKRNRGMQSRLCFCSAGRCAYSKINCTRTACTPLQRRRPM